MEHSVARSKDEENLNRFVQILPVGMLRLEYLCQARLFPALSSEPAFFPSRRAGNKKNASPYMAYPVTKA